MRLSVCYRTGLATWTRSDVSWPAPSQAHTLQYEFISAYRHSIKWTMCIIALLNKVEYMSSGQKSKVMAVTGVTALWLPLEHEDISIRSIPISRAHCQSRSPTKKLANLKSPCSQYNYQPASKASKRSPCHQKRSSPTFSSRGNSGRLLLIPGAGKTSGTAMSSLRMRIAGMVQPLLNRKTST